MLRYAICVWYNCTINLCIIPQSFDYKFVCTIGLVGKIKKSQFWSKVCSYILFMYLGYCWVIALDLVKTCHVQFVLCVAPNVFELEIWNIAVILDTMFALCYVPSMDLLVDLFRNDRFVALDLVKSVSFQYVLCISYVFVCLKFC